MNKIAISIALGAGALFVTAANAAPLSNRLSIMPATGVESVRVICDVNGRCFRSRGGQRMIIQRDYDSYNYGPRQSYVERRGYYDGGYYDRGPNVGIGISPAGVGIGFGRW
jgi:hypothetical protein